MHIDDESLVTDELVDYIHRAHTWSQEFIDARRQSVSLPQDYTRDLAGIQAPVLLIHGRYDRMVPFEVSMAILNHIADWHLVLLNSCGHWPPCEITASQGTIVTFKVGRTSRSRQPQRAAAIARNQVKLIEF